MEPGTLAMPVPPRACPRNMVPADHFSVKLTLGESSLSLAAGTLTSPGHAAGGGDGLMALGWGGRTDYARVRTRHGLGAGAGSRTPVLLRGVRAVCARVCACLCVYLAFKDSSEVDCARLEQLGGWWSPGGGARVPEV